MKSPQAHPEPPIDLRPIRFIIYLSGLAYGLINVFGDVENNFPADASATGPVVAALVGTIQLLAIIVGVVVDFSSHRLRWLVKPVFLVLSLAFLYETTLLVILGGDTFQWIPLLVYTAISVVVYLSER